MPRDLEIVHGKYIGEGHPCFIIAEIGQNHQGDIEIAKQLIKVAKESGADCVKFQKSCLREKFTSAALSRDYEVPNSWGRTYGEHKEYLEFSIHEMQQLQEYAEGVIGIPFTASAMDQVSANELDSIDVPFIKIGSGDTDNFPLLEHIAKMRRAIVLSTGMQDMNVVEEGYKIITAYHSGLVLMQCTSAYPTPACEANLRVINTYREKFPLAHVGLSCHEDGIAISIAAVALGARVIERHITLCKAWRGSDHACSLDPTSLKELVTAVRTVELALGSPLKTFQLSELPCKQKLGKSLVAKVDLPVGCKIIPELHLCIKVSEPNGLPASKYHLVKNYEVVKYIIQDEPIMLHDIRKPKLTYWDMFLQLGYGQQ